MLTETLVAGKCQFSAIWPAGWRSDFAGFSGGTGSCKCHQPLQTPNPNPSHPQPPLAPEIHKPVQVRRPPSPDSVSATMLLNSLIVSKARWCYRHVFSKPAIIVVKKRAVVANHPILNHRNPGSYFNLFGKHTLISDGIWWTLDNLWTLNLI